MQKKSRNMAKMDYTVQKSQEFRNQKDLVNDSELRSYYFFPK